MVEAWCSMTHVIHRMSKPWGWGRGREQSEMLRNGEWEWQDCYYGDISQSLPKSPETRDNWDIILNGKILALNWNQIPIQSLSQISCVTWNKSLHYLNLFSQLNSGDYNLQIWVIIGKKICEASFYWIQESRSFSWWWVGMNLFFLFACSHLVITWPCPKAGLSTLWFLKDPLALNI